MEVLKTDVFADWLDGLKDRQAAVRIVKRIDKIERSGHLGDTEPVGEGVRELRFHFGPGYRVYYIQRGETVIILLAGGDKDSQARDIDKAKEIAKALNAPE
ncbi:MAG: type II toxin-antitoxin system RelE/ParE family toxin [Alphaproteobacteria bacterium]|nr:type II toxin-antitoxin system RelE/ParE family toxin [Alphaproteobacteria bacterium]